MEKVYDCIIIGCGPAGACLGHRFSEKGINYLIVEKGEIAQSWTEMHDSLKLLSPMWVNQLPGMKFSIWSSFKKIPKEDFINYVKSFAEKFHLIISENTNVSNVASTNGIFDIQTDNGIFKSKTLINAAGYFSNPLIPQDYQDDHSIRTIHCREYKSIHKLNAQGIHPQTSKILIVGGRVSAGQLLVELYTGNFLISLSVQKQLKTRLAGILGLIKENLYYVKECIRFLFNKFIREDSRALMDGGETDKILRSGKVPIYNKILRIQSGTVYFADGKQQEFDLIIFATGYQPHIQHLNGLIDREIPLLSQLDLGTHKTVPGLFFLGVDNQVNFKSRYIRGIVSDSKLIANKVVQYLKR